jgi:predicted transcriptional regulator
MGTRKLQKLTPLELEIMQVVWGKEEVTVEEVREGLQKRGRPLALPSIRTMLGILQEKGYVTRRRVGKPFFYRALVTAEQGRRRLLKDIVDRAFAGSALELVAALVKADMVTEEELEQVRELLTDEEG